MWILYDMFPLRWVSCSCYLDVERCRQTHQSIIAPPLPLMARQWWVDGHHGVQPQSTVLSSGSSFQWEDKSLLRRQDKQDCYLTQTQTHSGTQAGIRSLIMSYCRSTLHIVHVCALFHKRMHYLTASHILIFCLMRGHLRGGSALRWKVISCWKMLFTVFTDVSLNCHPVGPAKLWGELHNADRTSFIVTLESMICLHNIMFDECTSCGIYYTNDSEKHL